MMSLYITITNVNHPSKILKFTKPWIILYKHYPDWGFSLVGRVPAQHAWITGFDPAYWITRIVVHAWNLISQELEPDEALGVILCCTSSSRPAWDIREMEAERNNVQLFPSHTEQTRTGFIFSQTLNCPHWAENEMSAARAASSADSSTALISVIILFSSVCVLPIFLFVLHGPCDSVWGSHR